MVQALAAGRVPALGLRDLQVGRTMEVQAIVGDLRRAAEGHSTVRFVAGRQESGKTFLLNLARSIALEEGFIVLQADLGPQRRFRSNSGEARALFRALASHVATSACPGGISINGLLQAWAAAASLEVKKKGTTPDEVHKQVIARLSPLHELPGGFDFATVLAKFYEAHVSRDDRTCENALRWLRAEYTSVDEAHADLGVRSIIDDDSLLRAIKLLSVFARVAGYKGLVVIGDELTLLSRRIKDPVQRGENYDFLVELLTESLEGRMHATVFLLAIEDSLLEDRIRGLYSNSVLAEWLAPNRFASNGHRDLASPVLRLQGLEPEHFADVLRRVHDVYVGEADRGPLMPQEDFAHYVEACHARLGDSYFEKPRQVIKHFLDLLHLLEQDRSADWRTLLASARLEADRTEVPSVDLPSRDFGPVARWTGGGSVLGKRIRRIRTEWALRIALPLVALIAVIAVWRGFATLGPSLRADLEVKISDQRDGIRYAADETVLPLQSSQYFSVHSTLSEPRYVYVLAMDANGHVFYPPADAAPPQLYTDRIQLPGGTRMWDVPDETGSLTVILLASRRSMANPETLKRRVTALGQPPRLAPDSMFVLRDGMIELRTSADTSVGMTYESTSDPGLLASLEDVFGHEFDGICAVALPLRSALIGS